MYIEVADYYYRNLCQRVVLLIRQSKLMERAGNQCVKHIKVYMTNIFLFLFDGIYMRSCGISYIVSAI